MESSPSTGSDHGLDSERLILIVVGAHIRAEIEDRPLGDGLRAMIEGWLELNGPDEEALPVVCTDLWYLNAPDLRRRPTVALGGPDVNAVTAYLANQLPTAMVIDDTLRMHLDPEYVKVQAAMWGTSSDGTAAAIELFCDRHLDRFLRSALQLPRLGPV